MFPRSIFSIRIINNRVSSQPFGVMFCCRRRSRSPRLAAGAARPRAQRLEVSVIHFDIDGVGEDVAEVLPLAYGPSTESLLEWLAWLRGDMNESDYRGDWFLEYKTEPMY